MEIVRTRVLALLFSLTLLLAGCGGTETDSAATAEQGPLLPPSPVGSTSRHPFAKYIELAGFRLSEVNPGTIQVKFMAISHSDADMGDITMDVRLMTTEAAPGDAPLAEFEGRILGLGPQGAVEVTATVATELRVYEIPDWQFLRADFEITFPEP